MTVFGIEELCVEQAFAFAGACATPMTEIAVAQC